MAAVNNAILEQFYIFFCGSISTNKNNILV